MPQRSSASAGCPPSPGMPPLVFLGPTLPQSEAEALLTASFHPPAQRGDIYRALAAGYTTIVLIDGEFHGRPSVWQREIADALAEGATVHGASSMGAIRAAELHTFGMIGHGRIFAWYRDGAIVADDEVALGYGPPELGYPAISEPLVNIRATLQAAPPELITPEERAQLIEFCRGLYFLDRSFAAIANTGPAAQWPAERRQRLAHFFREGRKDQKREDAIVALTAVAAQGFNRGAPQDVADPGKPWRRERLVAEGLAPAEKFDAAAIARRAGMTEREVRALRRELSTIYFVAQWGRAHGLVPSSADLARQRENFPASGTIPLPRLNGLLAARALADAAVRAFSAVNGTSNPEAAGRDIVLAWARDNGIACDSLEGEALVDWIIESSPEHFGFKWSFETEMIETLWLLGRLERSPREVMA